MVAKSTAAGVVLSSLNNQQSTVPSIVVSKASWPEKIGSAADCEGKRAPTANVDRSMPDNIGTSVDSPRDEEEVDDQGEPIRPRSSSLTVTEGSKPRANVYDRPALPRTRRAPLLVDTSEPAASRLPPVDPAVDKNHRGSGLFRSFQLGKSKRKKSPITDDRRLSADLGAVALTEKSIKEPLMSDNSDNIKGSQRSAFGQFVQSFRPRARSDSRHKPGEEPTALLTASNPHSVDVSPRSDVEDSTGSHASYAYTVVNTLPTTREDGDTLSALTPGRFARGSRHRMTSQLYPDNPAKKTWNIANLLLERKQKPKSNSPADVRDIFGPGRQRNYSGSKQLQVKQNMGSPSLVVPQQYRGVSHLFRTTPVANSNGLLVQQPGASSTQRIRLDKSKSVDQGDLSNGGSHSAAVLFRDGHAALLLSNSLNSLSNLDNKDSVYSQFMTVHKCYDLVPTSTKIVVFDTKLNVKKAFFALVYNGVRSAPLWDSEKKEYIGMLTITDFINILRTNYNSPAGILQELEDHKIWTWIEQLEKGSFTKKAFISVGPDESLFVAVKCLCDNKIHRLPVVDPHTGNVLYVLTHKRLLRFLYLYIFDLPRPSFMSRTPKELGIGSFAHVQTTTAETPLIDALNQFIEHRVSALPVVDRSGKVVDIYAKFDVINLAAEKKYENLNITVREALKHRADYFEGVLSCKESDSLMTVIETLVKAEVHRIAIVDDGKVLKGIVSLSDILFYLVVKTFDDHNTPSAVVEEEMGVAES